jgi:hypothetical protein
MIQNYVLVSHGTLCTQCVVGEQRELQIIDLPNNVAVIMNCDVSKMYYGFDYDSRLWEYCTNEEIFNALNRNPCSMKAFREYAMALTNINYKRREDHQNKYCVYLGKCPNVGFVDDAEKKVQTGMFQLPVQVTAKATSSASDNDDEYEFEYDAYNLTSEMFKKATYARKSSSIDDYGLQCFISRKNCLPDKPLTFDIKPLRVGDFYSTCLPSKSGNCGYTRLTLQDVILDLKKYYNNKTRNDIEDIPDLTYVSPEIRKQYLDSFYNHFHIIVVVACTGCHRIADAQMTKRFDFDTGLSVLFQKTCPRWLRTQLGDKFVVQDGGVTYYLDKEKKHKVYLVKGKPCIKKNGALLPISFNVSS